MRSSDPRVPTGGESYSSYMARNHELWQSIYDDFGIVGLISRLGRNEIHQVPKNLVVEMTENLDALDFAQARDLVIDIFYDLTRHYYKGDDIYKIFTNIAKQKVGSQFLEELAKPVFKGLPSHQHGLKSKIKASVEEILIARSDITVSTFGDRLFLTAETIPTRLVTPDACVLEPNGGFLSKIRNLLFERGFSDLRG